MGITIAGNGISGDSPSQLSIPKGLFLIKRTSTLYIADFGNARVQMLSLHRPLSSTMTTLFKVVDPSKIYVDNDDSDGPAIYVSVFIGNRVEKWTKNAKEGIQLGGECRSCFGVALDKEKNVYMSESDRHRIVQWSPKTNLTTLIAGQTDERGTDDQYLSEPNGIYYDRIGEALYVSDSRNNRIVKWVKGASEGIRVAGSNTSEPSNNEDSLDDPNGVWVDERSKVVYVADTLNNRITRWLPNASHGDTIAGGQGKCTTFLTSLIDQVK